jgi:hypothetical protein
MSQYWTSEEILFIKEHYPKKGAHYCADALNRTRNAVVGKASKLSIKRDSTVFRKTHEQYESELFRKQIDAFPVEDYIKSGVPIRHTCSRNHEWMAAPNNILAGWGCPHCYGNAKLTTEQYKQKVPLEYIVHGEYLGSDTPIMHEHVYCGKNWLTRPHDLLQGHGCPYCSTSKIKYELPTTLYFISWDKYFKLGITSKEEVRNRFRGDWNRFNMEVLWQVRFPTGKIAYTVEQKLLKSYVRFCFCRTFALGLAP